MRVFFRSILPVVCVLVASICFSQSIAAAPKKPAQQPNKSLTVKQVVQLVLPSVVRLTVLNKEGVPAVQGSGLVVGDDLIVTNMHVIAGGHAVTANFESGRSEAVFGVIALDREHDLVLLRAFTHGVRPLPLENNTSVQIGDPVIAVGSPEGLGGSISTGVVSGIRLYGGSRVIQTTAPISHGSSGGGLIDMTGRVIGVTSFFNSEGQNLNFAYPAYFLHKLILHQAKRMLTWKEIEDYHNPSTASSPSTQTTPTNGSPSVPAADTAVYTKKPLAGIKEVRIAVNDIAADARRDGLDSDTIKTAVELRLRQSGVPIVDSFSTDTSKPSVSLYISVNTLAVNAGESYVYSLDVEMNEYVTIYRPLPMVTTARTYATGNFGIIGKSRLDDLRNTINDMADKFANDFLAQNPVSHP